jgi:hypothetical protein
MLTDGCPTVGINIDIKCKYNLYFMYLFRCTLFAFVMFVCYCDMACWNLLLVKLVTCFIFNADCTYEYSETQMYVCMYVCIRNTGKTRGKKVEYYTTDSSRTLFK